MTLNAMIKDKIIDFWSYIKHYPETTETKLHAHLFFIPNNTVDTVSIKRLFEEADPKAVKDKDGKLIPLGIVDIHFSRFDDWYLYGLHDPQYLASKGQVKEFTYTADKVISSNQDELNEKISRIHYGNYKRQLEIIKALDNMRTPMELLRLGLIPINQYSYWDRFWETSGIYELYKEWKKHQPLDE